MASVLRNPRPLCIDIEYYYSFLVAGEPGYYTGALASLKIILYALPALGHLVSDNCMKAPSIGKVLLGFVM